MAERRILRSKQYGDRQLKSNNEIKGEVVGETIIRSLLGRTRHEEEFDKNDEKNYVGAMAKEKWYTK